MEQIRHSVLRTLEDGYYEVDLKGTLIYFNHALADILGRTPEDLAGLNFRAFTDPAYWDEVLEIYNEVYRTGESRGRYFHMVLRPDGTPRKAHFSVQLLRDEQREAIGFCGIVRDITEEDALRRTSETLRSVSELVSGTLDLHDVLKHCCDAVVEQSVADRASIYLYDPEDETFRPMMSRGVRDPGLWKAFANEPPATAENSPAYGRVLKSQEPVIIEDATTSDLLRRNSIDLFGLRSVVIYPLVTRGEFVGLLVVDAFRKKVKFPESEIDLMKQISRQLASAIHQAKLFDAVRAEAARFRMITTAMEDLVLVLDPQGAVEYASPSFAPSTGHDPDRLLGQRIIELIAPEDRKPVVAWFESHAEASGENGGRVEFRLRCSGGHHLWVESTATAVRDEENRLQRVVASGRVITERKRLEAELAQLAFYDNVTGLANRALLLDRLSQALERLQRAGGRIALCFVDLDRFKEINDTLGHAVGDQVLREVARRLNACVRTTDTLARFGGDEFVLLIDDVGSEDVAKTIVSRLERAMEPPLQLDGREIQMLASFGLAFSQPGATDADALLGEADMAMYKAKQGGGGHLVVSGDDGPRCPS